MIEINLELYDFLKDIETSLFVNNNEELIAIAFIGFDELQEFEDIVDFYMFSDDGGIDVKLQNGNICIELNKIFEYQGNVINDYKNCFNKEEVENYKEEIENYK